MTTPVTAIATATYADVYAGPAPAFLLPQKTTRRGERMTVYRWFSEKGSPCDGLRCGLSPARMIVHAKRHPAFSDVSVEADRIETEIDRLRPRAETAEHWAHLCALEAAYVTATGHQLPVGRS